MEMKYAQINQAAADKAAMQKNGQAWSSPQEMMEDKAGDYPHGFIDETSQGFRVWHDRDAAWYWVS